MDNAHIAAAFVELADLLELEGESPFKVRAYREFAETAGGLEEPLDQVTARGGLLDMPGVGKAIAGKVEELIQKGTFDALEKARAEVPATVRELLRVQGLGAKSIQKLWREANILSLGELAFACEEGRVALIPGFGAKKQQKIHEAVRVLIEGEGSMLLGVAIEISSRIEKVLAAAGNKDVVAVGDARRGHEVVRELLLLVKDGDVSALAEVLSRQAGEVEARMVKTSGNDVVLTFEGNARARVRGVATDAWVLSLIELTGSAAHLRWLQGRASDRGGLQAVCEKAAREEDVYAALELPFAPPELREGPTPTVPARFPGVHGIFHCHTDWSDGTATIADMARAAASLGYEYIGISDHSQAASYANGLDANRLRDQAGEIAAARREVTAITILHGVEVDILDDGALDLDDATLAKLDFVIASVHHRFNMSPVEMTARIIRAVSHPLVTMLGHPTGRLLLARKGYTFDVAAVAKAAAANDTYLEINANAQRLDLSDVLTRQAALAGVRFVINPDAHAPRGLGDTALGVTLARRAALGADQVLNACDKDDIVAKLDARKRRAVERLASS